MKKKITIYGVYDNYGKVEVQIAKAIETNKQFWITGESSGAFNWLRAINKKTYKAFKNPEDALAAYIEKQIQEKDKLHLKVCELEAKIRQAMEVKHEIIRDRF